MRRRTRRRGQAAIEFLFVIFFFLLTLLGVFEFCRFILTTTTLANAARVAVRYATTHGNTNGAGFVNGDVLPLNTNEIVDAVRTYTAGSMLDPMAVSVAVTYPTGGASYNAPGSRVAIQVTYPYQPFIALPMAVTLGSHTEGVITF
jgi:Flp pilus assembly protein TadG